MVKVHILTKGHFDKLVEPHLPGAMGLHVVSGLIIYEDRNSQKKGMIVEPGMAVDWENQVKEIEKLGLKLEDITHVLITHLHQDHIQALGKYPDGIHIFHFGASSILGLSEYGGKVYDNFIEVPEITFEMVKNAHSQKDTIYLIDSANEGKVAFVGDLAFCLYDEMPKENQKSLDSAASVDPEKRYQSILDFYNNHPEVEGFYLGHSGHRVSRDQMKDYLEGWKR